MTTWTDKAGKLHVVMRNGDHYVSRNGNYAKVSS